MPAKQLLLLLGLLKVTLSLAALSSLCTSTRRLRRTDADDSVITILITILSQEDYLLFIICIIPGLLHHSGITACDHPGSKKLLFHFHSLVPAPSSLRVMTVEMRRCQSESTQSPQREMRKQGG